MKKLTIECECGCSKLDFEFNNDGDFDELIITHYYASWYGRQQPIWKTIKDRLQLIWCGLTGKDYLFYELLFSGDNVKRVLSDLNKFSRIKSNHIKQ